MTSVVVDTNVFVSFLTDRDEVQQAQAEELLQAAARRELDLVVHQQVLTELIYVLLNLYGQTRESISEVVRDLLALPGVRTIDALEWSRVLDLWPDHFPDFTDAALTATCRSGRHDFIATLDETFNRRLVRLELESYW
jgi:predicted nucleic acid-binding protein